MKTIPLNLADLRQKTASNTAPAVWRSLEELAGTEEFREQAQREFPAFVSRWESFDGISRRKLLQVMGASLTMMGLSGCFWKQPQEKLVPYPQEPEQIIAGKPMFFATAMPFCGFGRGVLALSREGRPIKIEGNPDHPASLGASDVFMQASVLDLYDPDRSRQVMLAGQSARWGDFQSELNKQLNGRKDDGAGIRVLTGTVTSPTFIAQMQELQKKYPGLVWHEHEPSRPAIEHPYTEPVETIYDFKKAGVIVSFDHDFLFRDPLSLRYARHFIDGRRVRKENRQMNRLYVVESTFTLTGSMADHRLALPPSRIGALVAELARQLGVNAAGFESVSTAHQQWIKALADDLKSPAGNSSTLIVAGDSQPLAVKALVHQINQKLGNFGQTVFHIDSITPHNTRPMSELVTDISGGKVDTLLMIGVNPAYDAPADVPMKEALLELSQRGGFTVSLATHYDQTSYLCRWHIPKSHYLETWGDVRAFDGTTSIIQPLIAPLYGAHDEYELLEIALGRPYRQGLEIIRGYWKDHAGSGDFEQWWLRTLQKGVVENTAAAHRPAPALRSDLSAPPKPGSNAIEILFQTDASAWDGSFANNAWLQETPRPFTKLTWDNAIAISIKMAERWKPENRGSLADGDIVRLEYSGRSIEAPVILLPGQPDGVVTVYLGYGRTRGGNVMLEDGQPRGYDAYQLRTSTNPWAGAGVKITPTDKLHYLVMTRNHHAMSIAPGVPGVEPWLKPEVVANPGDSDDDLEINNRRIVRTATLQQFRDDPNVIKHLNPREEKKGLLQLYPGWDYGHGLQWGMSIDMTACIGCNACMVACQAENNIPVVGKDEVSRQREMHWIRIDDYFAGDVDSPTVFHQPVPCMHCENAPCEYVCPVGATTHSDEGLNEMTYNRCVGTRYCSNNCPYKVRRFNFLLFSDYETPTLKLLHNPDVTVRSRGVMEKCTYCVQRIDRTRVEMEKQMLDLQEQARASTDPAERDRLMQQAEARGREIVRDLQTACQQSCPTQAIIFGDLRDKDSEIAKLKTEPTDYGLLTELSTKPRTTYLARVTNPNPALALEVGA